MTDDLRRKLREIWERRQRDEITDKEATDAMHEAQCEYMAEHPNAEGKSDA